MKSPRAAARLFFPRALFPGRAGTSSTANFEAHVKFVSPRRRLKGRANDALRCILADYLNVPASAVKILSGETSRTNVSKCTSVATAIA
ncbi:MAG: DUF167 domain-containing protein [Candidatus Acidiferrales bacterium]